MNRAGHIALSLLAFSVVLFLKHVPLVFYLFVFLGAMAPDFDLPVKGLHRKLFHNVWFAALVGMMILDNVGLMPAQLFLIGFLTHLFWDALTPEGVYLLWPGKTRLGVARIRTGSRAEYFITLALFFLTFTLLLHYFVLDLVKSAYAAGFMLMGLIVLWLRPS